MSTGVAVPARSPAGAVSAPAAASVISLQSRISAGCPTPRAGAAVAVSAESQTSALSVVQQSAVVLRNTASPGIVQSGPQGPKGDTGSVGAAGPQGEPGPEGPPGTQGLGFGWANSSDATHTPASPLVIATGVEAQITVDGLGPLSDSSQLRPPFAGWPFWVGNRFRPLGLYDAYVFRLEFYAASLAVGNSLRFRMDIGGSVGTFYEDRKAFATMAGEARLFTFAFPFFAKDTFVANGAGLYVTPSTAPMSLWGASIEIQPQSAGS